MGGPLYPPQKKTSRQFPSTNQKGTFSHPNKSPRRARLCCDAPIYTPPLEQVTPTTRRRTPLLTRARARAYHIVGRKKNNNAGNAPRVQVQSWRRAMSIGAVRVHLLAGIGDGGCCGGGNAVAVPRTDHTRPLLSIAAAARAPR